MTSIWSKLGAVFEKPTLKRKELSPEAKKEIAEYNEKLAGFHSKVRTENSALYSSFVPKALLQRLMTYNDYRCTQWGSRKFGRLVNLARNIIDVEIHSEEGFQFDRLTVSKEEQLILKINVLMALFFPIPLKAALAKPDADVEFKALFQAWLVDEFKLLTLSEYEIFEAGVFAGVNNEPGNVILDVFHDALRFEEAQFGYRLDPRVMRTVLGKSVTYGTKVKKESERNLTPGWVFNFQALYDIDDFVDETKALEDNEAMHEDGIS